MNMKISNKLRHIFFIASNFSKTKGGAGKMPAPNAPNDDYLRRLPLGRSDASNAIWHGTHLIASGTAANLAGGIGLPHAAHIFCPLMSLVETIPFVAFIRIPTAASAACVKDLSHSCARSIKSTYFLLFFAVPPCGLPPKNKELHFAPPFCPAPEIFLTLKIFRELAISYLQVTLPYLLFDSYG
jgi:hypothetical protein